MLADKKTLVLVTRVKFWLATGGVYMRSARLIDYLAENLDLTVFFVGKAGADDPLSGSQFASSFTFIWHYRESGASDNQYSLALSQLCELEKFDACLVVRYDCAMFRACLPDNVTVFIDIDDLASEQDQGKKEIDMPAYWGIRFEEELAIFKQFDYLVVIHQEHKKKLSAYFASEKIIVCGHAVSFRKMPVKDTVKNIGFVGSFWDANIDAMYWFMHKVWPHYQDSAIHMHIYGEVARGLHAFPYRNVSVHKYVEDIQHIYGSCEIFVNPVRYGSGLKIKSIEAMANGLPLITSSEGARGLSHLKNTAFLVADSKREYLSKINWLVASKGNRELLAEAAYRYSCKYFSKKNSYLALLNKIYECSGDLNGRCAQAITRTGKEL